MVVLLNECQRIAEYRTAALLVGKATQFLTQSLKKSWQHIWSPNAETGKPTGCPARLMPQRLMEGEACIRFSKWLPQRGQ